MMGKHKKANPLQGCWIIEEMDQWDIEEESEELTPSIEFERNETGRFQFANIHGEMDCRFTQRDGQPAVELTWDGHDETEEVFGRGWAIRDGERLEGEIFFHLGDSSASTAQRGTE